MIHAVHALFYTLPIWLNVLVFLAGMLIMIKGGDWFTDSAVGIAEVTRLPQAVIGATVVSMATTFPEFVVSFSAVILDQPQTAIGNSVGSAICNIGLIVGTCVLIREMITHRQSFWGQGIFMLSAGVLITFFSRDARLDREEGFVLLALLVGYIFYSVRLSVRERNQVEKEDSERVEIPSLTVGLRKYAPLFLVGSAGVVIGSTLLVLNAVPIAHALGVPELVVALTMVALGTSLPEYAIALIATFKGHGALSIGNIIGANFLDITWVLGACSLLQPLHVERETQWLDFPVMLILMVGVFAFGRSQSRLRRWEGGVLFGVYIVYLAVMITLFGGPD